MSNHLGISSRFIDWLQLKALRQLIAACFIDQVAVRKDILEHTSGTKYASTRGIPYRALDIAEDVFIHPSSVLFGESPPDYIVFQEVVKGSKVWLKGKLFHQTFLVTNELFAKELLL